MEQTAEVVSSRKHQTQPPMDHFEQLLEETYLNHAYPVKYKLMTSGSLSRGMEVDKVPDKSDVTPFPREDAVMMTYDGRPSLGMCHASNLSLGTPACYGWGSDDEGM
jgi:hypothetical protein